MSHSRACATGLLVLAMLLLPGCNTLNPLCGSARPAPVMTSISPTAVPYANVVKTFQLTATSIHFVSASVIVVNGVQVATTVPSSTQLIGIVSTASIPGTGTFDVYVSTPSGNSGNLGCSSGGKSSSIILTVD